MDLHQLDRLLARRLHQQRRRLYHVRWLGGVVPLPVIHFDRLRFPRHLGWFYVTRMVLTHCVMLTARCIRFFMINMVILSFVNTLITIPYDVVSRYPLVNEMSTFVFRNLAAMQQRHLEIVRHDGDIFYSLDDDPEALAWQVVMTMWLNFYADSMLSTCHPRRRQHRVPIDKCQLIGDLLLFRFARVVERWLHVGPESNAVTMWVLTITFLYLLLGDFVICHIYFIFFMGVIRRISLYHKVIVNAMKIVWSSRKSLF